MQIIKLDATESTNTFLKDLSRTDIVDDYTVVWAKHQTKGRGQMDGSWQTEPGKNLTFSVLKKISGFQLEQHFMLNMIVSIAVFRTLAEFQIPKIKVKWPNDIMSGSKKICGILIENYLVGAALKSLVIGIGLNVNQTSFPGNPKASSLFNQTGQMYDLDLVLQRLLQNLKLGFAQFETGHSEDVFKEYQSLLFRKGVASTFQSRDGKMFSGIIQGVSGNGRLRVQLEDDSLAEFDIKEITLLY
ncbi:biotin--[acetyl-CoA-carboxylase] ligase [Maribacter sp. 4G9]|uniref:biotin--[acetyl-CoA-carboxylase] ligase n=1 Tax=Maribacter sp. 4G9 TaxID=1889777 RepID=UPI000C154A5C|nr:biotin--[acetyl-CoA-carboxylase] ligase [Maribacter sp. 4G9]PIB29852.1 biotin--[acetyl-CoA-carboxylase] ligase [Maribacter sp. 4G9]